MSGGGGGQKVQQTPTESRTVQELSPEQRQLFRKMMPFADQFASQPLQQFQGQRIAAVDPLQSQAQDMTTQAIAGMQPRLQQLGQASQFMMGPVMHPDTNPFLSAAMQSAVRPLEQQFSQQILPGIAGSAVQAGGFGGSRQGIAEGLAAQGLQQASGDILARMASDNHQQGIAATLQAMAMQPDLEALQFLPATGVEAIGQQRRAEEQALINSEIEKFMTAQLLPILQAGEIGQLAFGMPGGSTTTTGTQNVMMPGGPGALQTVLGVGGMLGSLAGAFGLSDRRLKTNISRIGTLANGLGVYVFNYIWGGPRQVGVMAQEVLQVMPQAVRTVGPWLAVNYALIVPINVQSQGA